MEVARTYMIHVAPPHFLWPFAVRYAAHQLNLWPLVSLPETSPKLRWTGEVGDALMFRVLGSRAFVCDTSADKLSPRAIPCVFLGFVPDAPGWQFHHPTSRRVFPSLEVTFDESVPFYRLFPYCSAPPPPPPLFSAADPLPVPSRVHVAVESRAARGAACGGAASGCAEPGGTGSEGAETRGAEPGGVETGGAEPGGVATEGVSAGASPSLSLQQLREWFVWRTRLQSGASGARGAGPGGSRGTGVAAGAGATGGTATTCPGGARTRGTGAAGNGGVEGVGAGDPSESGSTGARAGGAGVGGPGVGGAGGGGAGAVDPGGASQPPLQPASPLPAPSPYTQQSSGLTERREHASHPVSPVPTARRVPRSRPPPVPGTHAMTLRPSSVPLCVPLPAPPESSLLEIPDSKSDHSRAVSSTVSCLLATAVTDPSFESVAASALVAELLEFAATCRLDNATALVAESESASPPSVGGTHVDEVPLLGANIVDGMWIFRVKRPPGSPPAFKARYVARGFCQRQGVDYFHTFSPTPKMTTLGVLLHVAAQRDYELHSLDFSTAFLLSSLHEEIRLRRPPCFTGSFPAGTRWSLRRPVYGLRQAPCEWHNRLRATLVALGSAPATADPSLFRRTDTSLPPFYVLVYVDDLVFATADTKALTLVKSELQKRHTCTDLGPLALWLPVLLATAHSSVCQTLALSSTFGRVRTQKVHGDAVKKVLRYLYSTLGMGLVLVGRGPVVLTGHADASWVDDSTTQRSSQVYTFSLGSGSVFWQSTHSSSVLCSSCEAEIYAGAMAAQELRWLTYLLTDLGEQPRSPPVLYVDNKAMIALCQKHRLEHRTKHIALRYFLARELQQRGQLRLAYVATRANTADVFTKALPPGDHQRFSLVLSLLALLS
ncbi:unnamed protein product [Closterium sp. NIES-53]